MSQDYRMKCAAYIFDPVPEVLCQDVEQGAAKLRLDAAIGGERCLAGCVVDERGVVLAVWPEPMRAGVNAYNDVVLCQVRRATTGPERCELDSRRRGGYAGRRATTSVRRLVEAFNGGS